MGHRSIDLEEENREMLAYKSGTTVMILLRPHEARRDSDKKEMKRKQGKKKNVVRNIIRKYKDQNGSVLCGAFFRRTVGVRVDKKDDW